MAKIAPSARSMWFGAALFLAGSVASWDIRAVGEQTGTLRIGSRQVMVVSRASNPESFADWSFFFLASTVLCFAFSVICVALALHLKRKSNQ